MLHRIRLLLILVNLVIANSAFAGLKVHALRCEDLVDPVGIDQAQPKLSWQLQSERRSQRNQSQTGYQILVASHPDHLKGNRADLWDSGKVASCDSVYIQYQGKELSSGQACYWKVRVWDQDGDVTAWSKVSSWSMGLLHPSDWKARWIGVDGEEKEIRFQGADWIWFPEGQPERSAPLGTRYFRRFIEARQGIKTARLLVTGDNSYAVFFNGVELGKGHSYRAAAEHDLLPHLKVGKNLIAASVENVGGGPNPAGFAARLELTYSDGERVVVQTDESWWTTAALFERWEQPDYDHSTWLRARKLGPLGIEPWGDVFEPEDRRLAARYLRKEFVLSGKVHRATVFFSGLGLSELYLNGSRVGNHVLSPGLTEYDKRHFYVAHDITDLLRRGNNAAAVILGNGRFYAPRINVPANTRTYGYPKMRLQMQIDYVDGHREMILSDGSWKLSTNGPIQGNCEYDGEFYDARKEFSGWDRPGFEDRSWEPARLVSGPGGVATAQLTPPIRVTDEILPTSMHEPKPGVFIFDMGQNMVGWCQLRVKGPAGTQIKLRHAETLKTNGTLYLDNIRSAKVTDTYVLKGAGPEIYEPRFTYHGFRYVEVTGFPGKPTLETLTGKVVHDDLASAGHFICSAPILNQIYTNVMWGVRGNYRSIPTDCPQRDERQGWLGDRSAESKGESYLFQTLPLYRKWLQDMADAQKESGSVPDVCPSYWPIYSDNVTWPSSTVMIPASLSEQYAAAHVVREHYPSARNWMDYMSGFVTNGLISRDNYGDWCVPPEDLQLIHSKDPARKTDTTLLATAYFYHDARLMAQQAAMLGISPDVERYNALAEELKKAFNAAFYREAEGMYDNGSQSSCVIPLAFGLVPTGQESRVFSSLVRNITEKTDHHLGTGLIGGQWLMRVLSDFGRADLAFTIATNRSYPSWGYMVDQGATTIWELWNGNTADPAMNSGNHVMLVGDLVIWMHEYLAGIRSDAEQPGFKQILMRPQIVEGLDWVRANHQSPQGEIASEWRREGQRFSWRVTVPPNTKAILNIPAMAPEGVRENGRAIKSVAGLEIRSWKAGHLQVAVGSGSYVFQSTVPLRHEALR